MIEIKRLIAIVLLIAMLVPSVPAYAVSKDTNDRFMVTNQDGFTFEYNNKTKANNIRYIAGNEVSAKNGYYFIPGDKYSILTDSRKNDIVMLAQPTGFFETRKTVSLVYELAILYKWATLYPKTETSQGFLGLKIKDDANLSNAKMTVEEFLQQKVYYFTLLYSDTALSFLKDDSCSEEQAFYNMCYDYYGKEAELVANSTLSREDIKQFAEDTNIIQAMEFMLGYIDASSYPGKDNAVRGFSRLIKAGKKIVDNINIDEELAQYKKDEFNANVIDYLRDMYKITNENLSEEVLWMYSTYMYYQGKEMKDLYASGLSDYVYLNKMPDEYRNILYILSMDNSAKKSLTRIPPKSINDSNLIPEAEKNMVDALEEITNIASSDMTSLNKSLMSLFPRVKYLVNAVELPNSQVDYLLEELRPKTDYSIRVPAVPKISLNNGVSAFNAEVDIMNSDAYVLLLNTLSEIYYYREELLAKISKDAESLNLSSIQNEIQLFNSIYKVVTYVNCVELDYLWNGEITDVTGKKWSLQKAYELLDSMGAFEYMDEYNPIDENSPLRDFFDLSSRSISNGVSAGMSESAKWFPMQTNVYDPWTLKSSSSKYIREEGNFHYKYGYNRKALYIDTSSRAASSFYTTGSVGSTRVCTLRDLLEANDDVVLYIDDNFYNLQELQDLQDDSMSYVGNVALEENTSVLDKTWSFAQKLIDVRVDNIVKTRDEVTYKTKISGMVESLSGYSILSDEDSLNFIQADDYSIMQPFAVVSSLYKNEKLLTYENNLCKMNNPVFIASLDLPQVADVKSYYKNSIFNWLLIKNLNSNTPIGYCSNMDMESPVYMDIYGNILSESGLVVVPAAANATLHKYSYTPNTVAFLTYYGDDYKLPIDVQNLDSTLSSVLVKNESTGFWELQSRLISSLGTDLSKISTSNTNQINAIYELYKYDSSRKIYDYDIMQHLILEVLRGAPIEKINKDMEGLNTNRRLKMSGIKTAAKLEEIEESFGTKESNAILSLPTYTNLENFQYITLFVFKILVIISIVMIIIIIYVDAASSSLSWRTFTKAIGIPTAIGVAIIIFPMLYEITYYQSSKFILQKEANQLLMINTEKKANGKEVGVYEVKTPSSASEMYIKLDDTVVNWYDVFYRTFFGNIKEELDKVYKEYVDNHFAQGYDGIEIKNDGVYITADNLFKTSDINLVAKFNNLNQSINTNPIVSFYMPYYMMLDMLIYRINYYNAQNGTYSYSTVIQSGGKLKTLGLVKDYFSSEEFLSYKGDYFSLASIYGMTPDMAQIVLSDEDDMKKMYESQWVNTNLDKKQLDERVALLNKHMQEYIMDNINILGRVSDETFLKCLALDLSLYHNKIFGLDSANSLELFKVSNEDMLRLSTTSFDDVMYYSVMSNARFVYEVGGKPAVYMATMLEMLQLFSAYLQPILLAFTYLASLIALIVFRIILRRETSGYYGYAITMMLLCLGNIAHSLVMKLCIFLANVGLKPSICLGIQIILNICYLAILLFIAKTSLRDWPNLGFPKYSHTASRMINRIRYGKQYKRGKSPRYYYESKVRKEESYGEETNNKYVSRHKTLLRKVRRGSDSVD